MSDRRVSASSSGRWWAGRRVWLWLLAVAVASVVGVGAVAGLTRNKTVPPAPVSEIHGGLGGGSGEITAYWTTVDGATGYEVLRSLSPDGPFEVAVAVDVVAGTISVLALDVINLSSDRATYFPYPAPGTPLESERPSQLQYTELVFGPPPDGVTWRRYFRVVAYNSAGDAPPSVTVCGNPPGPETC